jgi:hypothetical protein
MQLAARRHERPPTDATNEEPHCVMDHAHRGEGSALREPDQGESADQRRRRERGCSEPRGPSRSEGVHGPGKRRRERGCAGGRTEPRRGSKVSLDLASAGGSVGALGGGPSAARECRDARSAARERGDARMAAPKRTSRQRTRARSGAADPRSLRPRSARAPAPPIRAPSAAEIRAPSGAADPRSLRRRRSAMTAAETAYSIRITMRRQVLDAVERRTK